MQGRAELLWVSPITTINTRLPSRTWRRAFRRGPGTYKGIVPVPLTPTHVMRTFMLAAIVGLSSLPHALAWGAAGAFTHSRSLHVPHLHPTSYLSDRLNLHQQATKSSPPSPSRTSTPKS